MTAPPSASRSSSAGTAASAPTVFYTQVDAAGEWELVAVPARATDALKLLRELFAAQPADYTNTLALDGPIAEVLSVERGDGVITVDLDRDVFDPEPLINCACPPGDLVMQQIVRTAQSAYTSEDPVLLTVRGVPARGIWGYELDGPEPARRSD